MKRILYILITLLVGLAGWQLGRSMTLGSEYAEMDKNKKPSDYSFSEVFAMINNGNMSRVSFFENSKKDTLPLSEISDSVDLFVYINPFGCAPCQDMTMNALEELKDRNSNIKIAVLLTDVKNRDLLVYRQQVKDRIMFYKVSDSPLKSVDDRDISSPVLFRLDSTLTIQDCYMVEYGDKYGINMYLKSY